MAKKIKRENVYNFSNPGLSIKPRRRFNPLSGIKKIIGYIFDRTETIKDNLDSLKIESGRKAKDVADSLTAFNIESDKVARKYLRKIKLEKVRTAKDKLIAFNVESDKTARKYLAEINLENMKRAKDKIIAFNIESDKVAREYFSEVNLENMKRAKDKLVVFNIESDKVARGYFSEINLENAKRAKDKIIAFNIKSDKAAREYIKTNMTKEKAKEAGNKMITFGRKSSIIAKEHLETFKALACAKEAWGRTKIKKHIIARQVFYKYFASAAITTVMVFMLIQFGFRPVVVVSMENKPVAVVPTKKDFEKVMASVQTKWGKLYDEKITLKDAPRFKLEILPGKLISTPTEVAYAIEANTNQLVQASAISVNGEVVAALNNEYSAQKVLDTIKQKYAAQGEKTQVAFCGDVKLVSAFTLQDKMFDVDKAVDYLTKNMDAGKTYVVKKGDTLWSIADKNNIPVEKLCQINPQLEDAIHPGEVVELTTPNCLINVKTTQNIKVNEETPFETKFESNDNGYRGDRKVVEKGKAGQKEVAVQVVRQNGVEVDRTVLNENIISQPKTEVIAIGTKLRSGDTGIGSGIFRVPAFGSVTSRFGFRWGKIHEGIDISGNIGDPIYAADGGTVIFSGVESGFGNLVKIDHGNGFITYYGHCSKLLVKVGQKINKGQEIAKLGNTGNSTGPHVHFQVMKNGSPVDPLQYLR